MKQKTVIIKMKIYQSNLAEEGVNKLGDRLIENTQSENQRETRRHWDNFTSTKICIIVVPEGKERKGQR